jgi:hypothetical protein
LLLHHALLLLIQALQILHKLKLIWILITAPRLH